MVPLPQQGRLYIHAVRDYSLELPDSVTNIGSFAFGGCTSLTDVYYTGSEAEWAEISIDNSVSNNSYLINATKHFNYVPEE